jgi:hypothetical protein
MQHWNGSIGSTIGGCWNLSEIFHRLSLKCSTITYWKGLLGQPDSNKQLSYKLGAVQSHRFPFVCISNGEQVRSANKKIKSIWVSRF